MNSNLKDLVNSIYSGNLLDSNKIFEAELKSKLFKKFDNKKSAVMRDMSTSSNTDDSSGNDELCSSGDSQVSEQNISTLLRHIRLVHPEQARTKILAKAESNEKKLTKLGDKKEFQ